MGLDLSPEVRIRYDKFVEGFIRYRNIIRAVLEVPEYRSDPATHSQNLMKHPYVQHEIRRRCEAIKARAEVSAQRTLELIAQGAEANMADFIRITEDGGAIVDLSHVDFEQMGCIEEVTSEVYTEGREDDAPEVKKVKIKLVSRHKYVEMLAKYYKLWADASGLLGPDGKPLPPPNLHIHFGKEDEE